MKAREAAFRVVHEVVYKKGYSNIALEQIIRKGSFEGKDAGFITEIALGTLRNKLFLEHVISNYSNIKIKKISPSLTENDIPFRTSLSPNLLTTLLNSINLAPLGAHLAAHE